MLIESLDADSGEKDTISKDQLVATLSSIFPAKPQAAIDALMAISEEQQQPSGSADIGYKKLLLEDAASTSPFLDLLRRQEKAERSEFVAEIVQAFKGKTEVTVDDLRQAILTVDPGRSEYEMTRMMMRGFAFTKASELESCTDAIEISSLIRLLQTGAVNRLGRRE
jgi:hypothetical protein